MKTIILLLLVFTHSAFATDCVDAKERLQPEFLSIKGKTEKYCVSEVRCKENSTSKLHTVICLSKIVAGRLVCPEASACFDESQKILKAAAKL